MNPIIFFRVIFILSLFLSTHLFGNSSSENLPLKNSPSIKKISPYFSSAIQKEETKVKIRGDGFSDAIVVLFGNRPATITKKTDKWIKVIVPPHVPGVVPVTVVTPTEKSAETPASYFVYQGDWSAYVTNYQDETVSIINTALKNLAVKRRVQSNPIPVAINPDGSHIFVGNNGTHSVSVIDAATMNVVQNIEVGSGPESIAITSDGTQLYVTNFNDNTVSVIQSTPSLKVLTTLHVGVNPTAITISPDGSQAYVANQGDNTVSVIAVGPNPSVLPSSIPVGLQPNSVAFTPDGTQAYVVNFLDGTVSVISTASPPTVIATLNVGTFPNALAITPDGTTAYVSNILGGSVSVIQIGESPNVSVTIPCGTFPIGVFIKPDGSQVYVPNFLDGTVSIINTSPTPALFTTLRVGEVFCNPDAIAFTPDGNQAYVVCSGNNAVSVVSTGGNPEVITAVHAGVNPQNVAIQPDQAPLAKFSVSKIIHNEKDGNINVSFDASGSLSPTGTIKKYVWLFGDGSEITTQTPFINHLYASPGKYEVILTVTNSAGTSINQFGTFQSGGNYPGSVGNALFNNGGPTARLKKQISIPKQ